MAVSSVGRLSPRPRPCRALSTPTARCEEANGTRLTDTIDRAIDPNSTAFMELRRINIAADSEPSETAPLIQANMTPMVAAEKPIWSRYTG